MLELSGLLLEFTKSQENFLNLFENFNFFIFHILKITRDNNDQVYEIEILNYLNKYLMTRKYLDQSEIREIVIKIIVNMNNLETIE